jgi:hypothetical protein
MKLIETHGFESVVNGEEVDLVMETIFSSSMEENVENVIMLVISGGHNRSTNIQENMRLFFETTLSLDMQQEIIIVWTKNIFESKHSAKDCLQRYGLEGILDESIFPIDNQFASLNSTEGNLEVWNTHTKRKAIDLMNYIAQFSPVKHRRSPIDLNYDYIKTDLMIKSKSRELEKMNEMKRKLKFKQADRKRPQTLFIECQLHKLRNKIGNIFAADLQ